MQTKKLPARTPTHTGCSFISNRPTLTTAMQMWMPIYDESVCEDAQQFMKQLEPALVGSRSHFPTTLASARIPMPTHIPPISH